MTRDNLVISNTFSVTAKESEELSDDRNNLMDVEDVVEDDGDSSSEDGYKISVVVYTFRII